MMKKNHSSVFTNFQPEKRTARVLCWVLSIVLLLSSLPLSVLATELPDSVSSSDGSAQAVPSPDASDNALSGTGATLSAPELGEGEKTYLELQEMELNLADLPEVISLAKAEEKGHVNRLRAQESDLNTVIYQNREGNKTTYVFAQPVKYLDESGNIRDKSSAITASNVLGVSYAMTDNDVKVYFPTKVTTGISLEYGDYEIRMTPQGTENTLLPTYSEDEESVAYANVFGRGTLLVYKTGLNGVKEDIVLVKNVGKNVFTFELATDGLTLHGADGAWSFRNADGELVARFSEIVIKDSGGKTTTGTLEVAPTERAGTYTLTVTAPADFLDAADTTYPVYIDPTVTVTHYYYHTEYNEVGDPVTTSYTAIHDTGVYTTTGSYDAADYDTVHTIGTELAEDGRGFVIYQLSDFFLAEGRFADLHPDQVISATLYLPVRAGGAMTLNVAPMTVAVKTPNRHGSSEYTVDPDGLNVYEKMARVNTSSTALPTAINAAMYSIDFTAIAQAWSYYNKGFSERDRDNPANGFIVYTNDTTSRAVAYADYYIADSDENALSVYYVVDTAVYDQNHYMINMGASQMMKQNGMGASVGAVENPSVMSSGWNLHYLGQDVYSIQSTVSWYDGYALKATASGVTMATVPEDGLTSDYQWEFVHRGGCVYQLRSVSNGKYLYWNGTSVVLVDESAITSVAASYWDIPICEDYASLQSFYISGVEWFGVGDAASLGINSTPANAGYHSNSDFIWTVNKMTFAVSTTGLVTCSSTVGDFVTVTATHKTTGKTATKKIGYGFTSEGIASEKVYQIVAKHSGKAVTVENGASTSGTNVSQYTLTNGYQWQRWKISALGNGEYRIQDMNSGYYLTAVSGDSGANVVVQPLNESSANQIFKFYLNTDGTYGILTKASSYQYTLEIVNSSTQNNANIRQYIALGSDNNHQRFSLIESVPNIDMLYDALRLLGSYADEYVQMHSNLNRNQLMLQYIRRNVYYTTLWEITAGSIDQDFVAYVDSKDAFLSKIFSGVRDRDPQKAGVSSGSFLLDPSGDYIDFYHLCATLNAMLRQDTNGSIFSTNVDNLAGWAADLITMVEDVVTYLNERNLPLNSANLYRVAFYFLESGGMDTQFSRADFISDIDSIAIYCTWTNQTFEDYLNIYYHSSYSNRFSILASKVNSDKSLNVIQSYLYKTDVVLAALEKPMLFLTYGQLDAIAEAYNEYFWRCVINES